MTAKENNLRNDLRRAALIAGAREVRYLVNSYYDMQDLRTVNGNRLRALEELGEPRAVVEMFFGKFDDLEGELKAAMDYYTQCHALSVAARAQAGIGPVISAGLLAHINLHIADTPSKIFRFAGLDPSLVWMGREKARALVSRVLPARAKVTPEVVRACADALNLKPDKMEKRRVFICQEKKSDKWTRDVLIKACATRPYNAGLKVLCWKIGHSFNMLIRKEGAFYGQLLLAKKEQLVGKNEAGDFAEAAAKKLEECAHHKQAAILKEGRLPDGQIQGRAERWTVKIFLAHYWATGREHLGLPTRKPYPIEWMGHTTTIDAPAEWREAITKFKLPKWAQKTEMAEVK